MNGATFESKFLIPLPVLPQVLSAHLNSPFIVVFVLNSQNWQTYHSGELYVAYAMDSDILKGGANERIDLLQQKSKPGVHLSSAFRFLSRFSLFSIQGLIPSSFVSSSIIFLFSFESQTPTSRQSPFTLKSAICSTNQSAKCSARFCGRQQLNLAKSKQSLSMKWSTWSVWPVSQISRSG